MKQIKKEQLYLSTIAPRAAELAEEYGVGLEIAEFCTAYNMDEHFAETDAAVQKALAHTHRRLLHAPFNELFPCAIDPKARELAASRYRQALALTGRYSGEKTVIHTGYAPNFYYDCWFEEQSILFWRAFVEKLPENTVICLENVLDTQPEPLLHVLEGVRDSRLRVCLDVGHAHTYSHRPVEEWLALLAPYVDHFHIHNNSREYDAHGHLYEGTMDMAGLLQSALERCPQATFTLEIPEPESDLQWLLAQGLLTR